MRFRAGLLVAAVVLCTPAPASAAERPERVVVISLPGIMWSDIEGQDLPNLRTLLRSIGALSARTASRVPDVARGYLTLGAGNPAFVAKDDPDTNLAFEDDDRFESGTAGDALRRRTGRRTESGVVHVSVPRLQEFQDSRLYGTELGALGEALREADVPRAVVSAADVAVRPAPEERRRGAVLALMDADGGVEGGALDGLLRPNEDAAFGVETDPDAFVRAARRALDVARVVLLDPGETSRADEYTNLIASDRVGAIRRDALRRVDAIVGRVRRLVTPRDMVLVLGASGPTGTGFREHLVPMGAWGRRPDGGTFGESWLTSPTTRRQGMVVISDVAPMVLQAMDVPAPDSMIGTPIGEGEGRTDGAAALVELDEASSVRERFAATAFWVIASLLSLLAILAFVVFLGSRGRYHRLLVAVAYFGLAVFSAAHIIRAFEYWHVGVLGSHLLLYGVAALLAVAAWFVPGPRWAGGVALLVLAVLLFGSDVAMGGALQVNGVFGHSPLVAGRFYGVSNPGYTILFSAALLGFTGLAELQRQERLPVWGVVACVVLLPLIGLPSMGADFGGLLAGVPAVGVTIALGRGWRIRWRTIVAFAVVAVVAAIGLSFVDLLRPPEARTHLGRFAALIAEGDLSELGMIVQRKGVAALKSLTVTRWTYFIPVGLAVLALLLIRPRGVLRDVLPQRRLLRAGLWGTLVAGILGFAVNDSGISIPALALAFTVPFLVLVAVEAVEPRKTRAMRTTVEPASRT
jgi:hypothetical protein